MNSLVLRRHSVLPGFGLAMGFTVAYLSFIVLIPLAGLFLKTASISWPEIWQTVTSPRALASYRLTFGASFIGASLNVVFGVIVAWVLVRYSFPGRRIVVAIGRDQMPQSVRRYFPQNRRTGCVDIEQGISLR